MFPANSQTIIRVISSSTEILPSGDYFVYSTHLVSDNLSNVNLRCGNEYIAVSGGINRTDEQEINYHCQSFLIGENAGLSQGFISITYSTSSNQQIFYNGFTGGEIVISLFVFWIFCFLIFNFVVAKFLGFFNKK